MEVIISVVVCVLAVAFVVGMIWLYAKKKDKFGGCCGDCSKCSSCASRNQPKNKTDEKEE